MHHAPRGVVIWPEVDVPGYAGSVGRIHHEAGCGMNRLEASALLRVGKVTGFFGMVMGLARTAH